MSDAEVKEADESSVPKGITEDAATQRHFTGDPLGLDTAQ